MQYNESDWYLKQRLDAICKRLDALERITEGYLRPKYADVTGVLRDRSKQQTDYADSLSTPEYAEDMRLLGVSEGAWD